AARPAVPRAARPAAPRAARPARVRPAVVGAAPASRAAPARPDLLLVAPVRSVRAGASSSPARGTCHQPPRTPLPPHRPTACRPRVAPFVAEDAEAAHAGQPGR